MVRNTVAVKLTNRQSHTPVPQCQKVVVENQKSSAELVFT